MSVEVVRKLLVGLALVLVALVVLAAQWPATHGIARLTAGSDLELSALEGTVWSGTAGSGRFGGLELGRVHWKLDPLALPWLALRAEVVVDGAELAGRGIIERARDGVIEGRNLRGRLPASWLQRILNEPFLRLGGQIHFDLAHARIGPDGRLDALDGLLRWQAARLTGGLTGGLTGELGDLEVHWRTESAGVILGTLSDSGGALRLEGTVTVTADHYQIEASLGARGDQLALRQVLDLLGRPDASGRLALRISGPMLPLTRGGG